MRKRSSRKALEGLRCRLHGRSGARRGRGSGIGLSMGCLRRRARVFRARGPWRLFRVHRRCRRRLARKGVGNAGGRRGERRA